MRRDFIGDLRGKVESGDLLARQSRALGSAELGRVVSIEKWWRGTESNCRHYDFQSYALPTELPRHAGKVRAARAGNRCRRETAIITRRFPARKARRAGRHA